MAEPNGNGNGVTHIVKLARNIPYTVWVAILAQLVTGGVWLVRLDNRVVANAEKLAAIESRLADMDDKDTKAGVLVRERVRAIETEVSWLINAMTGVRGPRFDPSAIPPLPPGTPPPPGGDRPEGHSRPEPK